MAASRRSHGGIGLCLARWSLDDDVEFQYAQTKRAAGNIAGGTRYDFIGQCAFAACLTLVSSWHDAPYYQHCGLCTVVDVQLFVTSACAPEL